MNRNADQLTLHEATAVVLRGRGWVERDLYLRPQDGQPPPSWQLGMRVRKYRDWFEARGPSGAQIRLVPGGPGEAVDSPVPARTTRCRSSPGSSGQISASASPTSADTKKAREQRARAARKYKPDNIETLLVAEAPPSSTERYFYFEHVRMHDSLFRHVANAILGQTPTRSTDSARPQAGARKGNPHQGDGVRQRLRRPARRQLTRRRRTRALPRVWATATLRDGVRTGATRLGRKPLGSSTHHAPLRGGTFALSHLAQSASRGRSAPSHGKQQPGPFCRESAAPRALR